MNLEQYISNMQKIQRNILDYVDNEANSEKNYINLNKLFDDLKIRNDQHTFRLILHLIARIANNHHRTPNFFSKIFRILKNFKNEIQMLSNRAIFDIFQNSKRILLFLVDEKMFYFDRALSYNIIRNKYYETFYPEYFYEEIKSYLSDEYRHELAENMPQDYEEKRRVGENDIYLCKLIRNDQVQKFIDYVNKEKISLNDSIKISMFETNNLLNKNKPTLIEYAAFYGSMKIINYLITNNVRINPSIWIYAIHNQNIDLIHLLEQNNIEPTNRSYVKCLLESLKCHHNEIADYIQEKYLNPINTLIPCIKYYNFKYLTSNSIDKNCFFSICQYDYYYFVEALLKDIHAEINDKKIISIVFYSIHDYIYLFFNLILYLLIQLINKYFNAISSYCL